MFEIECDQTDGSDLPNSTRSHLPSLDMRNWEQAFEMRLLSAERCAGRLVVTTSTVLRPQLKRYRIRAE
jgi:hypothetical protein